VGRHSQDTKETIIDAAEDVVIQVGAGHLTLDAVAAKAGVSKGGLLYHFHSKDDLLRAMLERRVRRVAESRSAALASLPEDRKSLVTAHVLATEGDERAKKLSASLMAAVAYAPRLLNPYREEFRRNIEEFCRAGLTFERAAVVALAIDGMKLLELLSVFPFVGEERERVMAEIIALSKEGTHV
jgi:AcrR family transcriptional regulator